MPSKRRLIEDCWNEEPNKRPTFREIIFKLDEINNHLVHKRRWKVKALKCLQKFETILKLEHSKLRSGSSHSTIG